MQDILTIEIWIRGEPWIKGQLIRLKLSHPPDIIHYWRRASTSLHTKSETMFFRTWVGKAASPKSQNNGGKAYLFIAKHARFMATKCSLFIGRILEEYYL